MLDRQRIHSRVQAVAAHCMELPAAAAQDVAFHMTDWLDDLELWAAFCADPEALDDEAASDLLLQFLIHVPPHVAAASKLYTGLPVTDIFGIGATSADQFVSPEVDYE